MPLASGMTEKDITSQCYLSTFAWTFPMISAALFLAYASLVTTFWFKECAITGIEGLMSSGSATYVTGTLYKMMNAFCWTVHMMLLSAFARVISLSSHLIMRMDRLV